MKRLAVVAACVLGIARVSAQQPAKEVALHTLNAFDILYVLAGGGENAMALMRDDGVVLIDPLPFGWGKATMAAIETVCDQPVRTIVNIRSSEEHLKANTEYPAATKIIAHKTVLARAKTLSIFAGAAAKFAPNTPVDSKLTVLEGPDLLDIYSFGRGRTDGDLVLVFSAKGTAYFGDLFPSKAVPVIEPARGGSSAAFLQTVTKIRTELKGVRSVVPGRDAPRIYNHGAQKPDAIMPLSQTSSWKDFEDFADFTSAFVTAVQDAKKSGKASPDQAVAGVKLPDRFKAYDMRGAAALAAVIYAE